MATKEEILVGRNVNCLVCHKRSILSKENTYKTNSIFSLENRTIVCKQCIRDIYNAYFKTYQNDRIAVYYTCRKLDFPFHEVSFQMGLNQFYSSKAKSPNMFGIYVSKIASIGKSNGCGKNFDESDPPGFDEVNNIQLQEEMNANNKYLTELLYSKKWHGAYSQADLDYLNKYYDGILDGNNILGTNHEDYAMQISILSLKIRNTINDDNISNLDKLQKNFDVLSSSAKINAKSKGNENKRDNLSTIIADIEREEWIEELKSRPEVYTEDEIDHLVDQYKNIERSL